MGKPLEREVAPGMPEGHRRLRGAVNGGPIGRIAVADDSEECPSSNMDKETAG